MVSKTYSREAFGDYQTPLLLVEQVLACLARMGCVWGRVLEPTCGQGNFIRGVLQSPLFAEGGEVYGIELQSRYMESLAEIAQHTHPYSQARLRVLNASIFDLQLDRDLLWSADSPLLVVGNLPWATNAALGQLNSDNLPIKYNRKGLKGLGALTGEANFDISEFIILKLIEELQYQQPTIALLCKTSVARNVLSFASRANLPIAQATVHRIDATQWFGAAVEACLFIMQVAPAVASLTVPVYRDLTSTTAEEAWQVLQGSIIADHAVYEEFAALDGTFPLEWRQGIKHDAAAVMELIRTQEGCLRNKLGEVVDVETDYVFPLLKSSDVHHFGTPRHRIERAVIVPQRFVGEETDVLRYTAPKLWNYLNKHRSILQARKSSIYTAKPPFSIFGVGDYAFSKYKVVVSGFYPNPRFVPLGIHHHRPYMVDDTCYLIPCRSATQAALLSILLNDPQCTAFLQAISFADAKRPITKKVLQRIQLDALIETMSISHLKQRVRQVEAQLG